MVKLATDSKSLTHYTKGTQSPHKGASTACTHTVSGSISLPSPGFFSPFPHGTGSLSVGQEYLALEDGPPMFRQGFTCPALLNSSRAPFRVPGYHRLGPVFPDRSAKTRATFGLFPVRSSLLGESRLISFPRGNEIFQFSRFASRTYGFSTGYRLRGGFPHSDISGSMLVASSPELFAGCHVLHRL